MGIFLGGVGHKIWREQRVFPSNLAGAKYLSSDLAGREVSGKIICGGNIDPLT